MGADGAVEWPDLPDFPTSQYLWVGSLGPGEKRAARYEPTKDEQRNEPIETLFEIELTDGRQRDWNRSHDGTTLKWEGDKK